MNILFTSAGRRDYLIEYFVDALCGCGRVHVGNSDPLCSAFTVGDEHVITPPIHHASYVSFLLDYCRRNQINAVVPLFDIDLPILAKARYDFAAEGIQVIVASSETINICNDKWRTVEFLNDAGLNTPRTFLNLTSTVTALKNGEIAFPLIVKPRWGMGSIGLMQADNLGELKFIYEFVRRRVFGSYLQFESATAPDACVLIQEQVIGSEYGLDVFNDLDGQHIVTLVKRKLGMRSGETDIATTIDWPDLEALGASIAKLTSHPGNLDVDVFVDGDKMTVLELNCRFGGGYPFSHAAGANFPAAIVAWLRGDVPNPNWLRARAGVTAVKSIRPKIIASK